MEDIIIRSICEEDFTCIADLCGQLGYPAQPEDVLLRIRNILQIENHRVFVADLPQGKVVGWVHTYISPMLECGLHAEIGGLVVDSGYRNKGIGRQLMQKAENWARLNKCGLLSLRSNIVRKEAHKFYESIGYTNVKEQYTFRKQLE